jgi:hypothetical protein
VFQRNRPRDKTLPIPILLKPSLPASDAADISASAIADYAVASWCGSRMARRMLCSSITPPIDQDCLEPASRANRSLRNRSRFARIFSCSRSYSLIVVVGFCSLKSCSACCFGSFMVLPNRG